MNWKAVVVAFVALGLLENVLSHRQAIGNVTGAENGLVGLLKRFIDPNVPAFDLSPRTSSGAQPLPYGGHDIGPGNTPNYPDPSRGMA